MAARDPWQRDPENGEVDVGRIVTTTFGVNQAAAEKFLETLRDSQKDLAASLSRNALLVVTLIGFFLLLTYARGDPGSRVTVGPVGVTDVSALERALPAIIAYLIYQLSGLTAAYQRGDWVVHAIETNYRSELAASRLADLLTPQLPRLYAVAGRKPKNRLESTKEAASLAMTLGVIMLPLVFETFAFYRLFDRYGPGDVVVGVALVLSVIAIVSTVATWIESIQHVYTVKPPASERFLESRVRASFLPVRRRRERGHERHLAVVLRTSVSPLLYV